LNLQKNPDFQSHEEIQAGSLMEKFISPFVCPITNRPVNGKNRFCALIPCGHVISSKGLSGIEAHETDKECYVCQSKYTDEDVLILNPTDEEREILSQKLVAYKKGEVEEKREKRKLKSSESTLLQLSEQKKEEADIIPTNKKRKIIPNVAVTNGSLVKGSLSVKSALKSSKEDHDISKKASETYLSIFTKSDQKSSGVYMTGIYLK